MWGWHVAKNEISSLVKQYKSKASYSYTQTCTKQEQWRHFWISQQPSKPLVAAVFLSAIHETNSRLRIIHPVLIEGMRMKPNHNSHSGSDSLLHMSDQHSKRKSSVRAGRGGAVVLINWRCGTCNKWNKKAKISRKIQRQPKQSAYWNIQHLCSTLARRDAIGDFCSLPEKKFTAGCEMPLSGNNSRWQGVAQNGTRA